MATAPPLTLDALLAAILATAEASVDAPCLMCDGHLERVNALGGDRLQCRSCGSAIEDAVPVGAGVEAGRLSG